MAAQPAMSNPPTPPMAGFGRWAARLCGVGPHGGGSIVKGRDGLGRLGCVGIGEGALAHMGAANWVQGQWVGALAPATVEIFFFSRCDQILSPLARSGRR